MPHRKNAIIGFQTHDYKLITKKLLISLSGVFICATLEFYIYTNKVNISDKVLSYIHPTATLSFLIIHTDVICKTVTQLMKNIFVIFMEITLMFVLKRTYTSAKIYILH